MGSSAQFDLDAMFRDAERKRLCAIPSDKRANELMRRAVAAGVAVRPARGMYARADRWRALSREQQAVSVLRTMQRLHPAWTFACESAGVMFGLPVARADLDEVHVATSPVNRKRSAGGVKRHRVEGDAAVFVDGVRVTSFDRTVFDCMRRSSFGQALAVADAALRLANRSSRSFAARFRSFGVRSRGAWRAERTMLYADARSESGGESLARAAMIELGFCLPELQVQLADPVDPRRSYRVDFAWLLPRGGFVIGEFDGMEKYENTRMRNGRSPIRVLADEQHRESRLSLYGAPIVRFSYADVMDRARFQSILEGYGIPRSDRAASFERLMVARKKRSAVINMVVPL